ncbi:hypothetical protein G9U51_12800 [Calidifontibacter sp. DB0510]|uniref:Uncharacterized protein n=1 Tax=Metallococcus carri TaxID=1656884 RepID=A0A967B3F7_9MICO|nr:hypothetical protein [Metallococcus carri]NHN56660.1 hypothetical protein [Metallococcus carri]NOP38959.1 hypothetical protein [Calidifontibacter sp. DB2511S]
MVRNKAAAAIYWVIALLLSVVAGVGGAAWGNSMAPTFANEDKGGQPATSASRLLFSVFGGLLCGLGVLAVFAGIWLALWVRQRRADAATAEDDYDDYDHDADLFEDDEDEDSQQRLAEQDAFEDEHSR